MVSVRSLSQLTARHSPGLASTRVTNGSAASTSPHCAAAKASSATDGGTVLSTCPVIPTMSTGNGLQARRQARATAPPAASA